MTSFEIDANTYFVHPLTVIGYAEVLTNALIQDAYSQLDQVDDSGGRDLNKVRRKDAAQARLDRAVIEHAYEPNGPQFLRSLTLPHGMVLAAAISLSDDPRDYRSLQPTIQKLFDEKEERFAEIYWEVGSAAGFLSAAKEAVASASGPPRT